MPAIAGERLTIEFLKNKYLCFFFKSHVSLRDYVRYVHVCAGAQGGHKRALDSSELECVLSDVKCQEPNPSLLQEQYELLTAELSLSLSSSPSPALYVYDYQAISR